MTLLSNPTNESIANERGAAVFKCPGCLQNTIVRSAYIRKRAIRYHCSCGFSGPN